MNEAIEPARRNRILVVDDTSANLQLLSGLLTEHGFRVYPASDGELALEFVHTTLPDLILLDIRMPGLDGYEVCRQLKADERTHDIPIIFISILEDERDKVRGFKAGAVDYITKPFQPEEVLARIKHHLQLRDLTEQLEQRVAERTAELIRANRQLQLEIGRHKQAQEEIALLHFALDHVHEAAFLINEQGRFRFVNEESCRALRYPRAELLALTVSDVDPEFPLERWPKHWQELRTRGTLLFEGNHRTKDGHVFPVEISANYFEYRGEGFNLALVRDISARKQAEEELRSLNDELDRRVQARTAELEAKNAELERANKLFVGRELRMVELKERLRALEKKTSS